MGGYTHDGKLGCVHEDKLDMRSASMFESKLVNGEPIPVLIDWSLVFNVPPGGNCVISPKALLGISRGLSLLNDALLLSLLLLRLPRGAPCPGAFVRLYILILPTSDSRSLMSTSTPSSIDVVIM